jgi:hypothetical protein
MTMIERLDAFARQQKRRWMADARRQIKIARHGVERAYAQTTTRAGKVWSRRSRRAAHVGELWLHKVERPVKIVRERLRNIPAIVVNVSRKAALRAWAMRRPFMRWRSRRRRVQEKWGALKAEIALDQEIERIADDGALIVVGPWLSEVGFETLYWVPFVRWFQSTYRVKSDRLMVLTRGGANAWYSDITSNHVEIFDLVTPEAFAAHNARKTEADGGTIKQLALSPFEADLVERARAQWGAPSVRVLHPSVMYRLFQQFWAGNRPLSFLDEHTHYSRIAAPGAHVVNGLGLPDDYVAVKFYSAQSLQDTPETRQLLRELLAGVAEQYPIVLLDTGLALDDHGEYEFARGQRVISAREWMQPRNNLAVQTQIIAGARAFVGTCGSIAWLAPMLGTDTTAVMTDVKFLNVHLHVARRVYRVIGGGRFTPLDLGGLHSLGLSLTGTPRAAASTGAGALR